MAGFLVPDWSTLILEIRRIYDGPVPEQYARTEWRVPWYGDKPWIAAWFIQRGSVVIETQHIAPVTISAGNWLIPPNCLRKQTFSNDNNILSINLEAAWITGQPLYRIDRPVQIKASRVPLMEKLARRILKSRTDSALFNESAKSNTHLSLNHYLTMQQHLMKWMLQLIVILRREGLEPQSPETGDSRVVALLEYLRNKPLSEHVSIDELGAVIGLSAGRLNQIFIQATGITPHQYWDRWRLQHVKRLLLRPDTRIKQIAFQCGFDDLSHFSGWFKRGTGLAPRAYRQQSRDHV
jgi:AraC-like DNA-binding protein